MDLNIKLLLLLCSVTEKKVVSPEENLLMFSLKVLMGSNTHEILEHPLKRLDLKLWYLIACFIQHSTNLPGIISCSKKKREACLKATSGVGDIRTLRLPG